MLQTGEYIGMVEKKIDRLLNAVNLSFKIQQEQEISNSRNSGMCSEMHHQYVDAVAHSKP